MKELFALFLTGLVICAALFVGYMLMTGVNPATLVH